MRSGMRRAPTICLFAGLLGISGCQTSHSAVMKIDSQTLSARLAQTAGSIRVPGLKEEVRVVRDRRGIPHIYAKNVDDLFMAQGFVQAQDRLFQMDLWRRSVQGRLAEILGPGRHGS